MAGGRRVAFARTLSAIRERRARQVAVLPETLRRLASDDRYVVEPRPRLVALRRTLAARAADAEELADGPSPAVP